VYFWFVARKLVAMITRPAWARPRTTPDTPRVLKATAAVFWAATLGYALLVWAFPYVPTQDGPSHLGNALMLKGLGDPQTRYSEYYTLRMEAFPNWTCHVLLVALLHVLPPVAAEKALVSLYVVGLAISYRYFLGSFGEYAMSGAAAVLLFMFNKCFFMGFYGYCLSLVLVFFIFGYLLRLCRPLGLLESCVLGLVFLIAYFTHIVGFGIAAIGSVCLMAFRGPARSRSLLRLAVALVPATLLMVKYLATTKFFDLDRGGGITPLRLSLEREVDWERLSREYGSLREGLGAMYDDGPGPMDWMVLALVPALLVGAVWTRPASDARQTAIRPIAALTILIFLLHFFLPDQLGQHGGYFRIRLAPILALLIIACLRSAWNSWTSAMFQAILYALVGWNALLLANHFRDANEVIMTFSAGASSVGQDRTLVVCRSEQRWCDVDYLAQGAYYYCLDTRNINLDNYEADTFYFPLRYRVSDQRWRGAITAYYSRHPVDIIVLWKAALPHAWARNGMYKETYRCNNLTIYERQVTGLEPVPVGE